VPPHQRFYTFKCCSSPMSSAGGFWNSPLISVLGKCSSVCRTIVFWVGSTMPSSAIAYSRKPVGCRWNVTTGAPEKQRITIAICSASLACPKQCFRVFFRLLDGDLRVFQRNRTNRVDTHTHTHTHTHTLTKCIGQVWNPGRKSKNPEAKFFLLEETSFFALKFLGWLAHPHHGEESSSLNKPNDYKCRSHLKTPSLIHLS
jgi:hypothetical protein